MVQGVMGVWRLTTLGFKDCRKTVGAVIHRSRVSDILQFLPPHPPPLPPSGIILQDTTLPATGLYTTYTESPPSSQPLHPVLWVLQIADATAESTVLQKAMQSILEFKGTYSFYVSGSGEALPDVLHRDQGNMLSSTASF